MDKVENQEKTKTPLGSYFIRGIEKFKKGDQISIIYPTISVSLQLDGKTRPIREYGYVVELDEGAIQGAFDRDVSSKPLRGRKTFGHLSFHKKFHDYGNDLINLLHNTRPGSHNEIWVNILGVDIIGGYMVENTKANGYKKFTQAIQNNGLPMKVIPIKSFYKKDRL